MARPSSASDAPARARRGERAFPSTWWFMASLVVPFIRATSRYRVHHAERLPRTGAFILTPNHISNVDPMVVGVAMWDSGRVPRFLAKASLFRVPFVGFLFRRVGQIPVERGGQQRATIPLDAATRVVDHGQCVVIYPEGALTRDPDLWPMRGKIGAARLALELGIPVIPLAHWGAQDLMPTNTTRFTFFPRPHIDVLIGHPIDLSEWAGGSGDTTAERAATERIMQAITALLEELRGETAPAERWNPAHHNQSEVGRF